MWCMAGSAFPPAPGRTGRPPRPVGPGLWLFPPNPETHGGSSWLLETSAGDVLVDCPPDTEATLEFVEERASRGPGWMVLLGRDGHGHCRRLRERLGWPLLVQEQEAYLLPGVEGLRSFGADLEPLEGLRLIWTPGASPGGAVLHARGGVAGPVDGLFCGRLLVPLGPQRLGPVPSPRGFHGPRQRRSAAALAARLPPGSPDWIATGAALGALQGEALVHDGARLLAALAGVGPPGEGAAIHP
ncbi:MAG: MBL fold metallo-hydrolase [Cyanobacteriota bacterium]|nr:MBL fold metallo-hydrolase [Cyanobacteriota bacterium]